MLSSKEKFRVALWILTTCWTRIVKFPLFTVVPLILSSSYVFTTFTPYSQNYTLTNLISSVKFNVTLFVWYIVHISLHTTSFKPVMILLWEYPKNCEYQKIFNVLSQKPGVIVHYCTPISYIYWQREVGNPRTHNYKFKKVKRSYIKSCKIINAKIHFIRHVKWQQIVIESFFMNL